MVRVGIVGATSWGRTLGELLTLRGHEVKLLARNAEDIQLLRKSQNRATVSATHGPGDLEFVTDPGLALRKAEIVFFVVPSHTLAMNLAKVVKDIGPKATVVSGTKGLERETGRRMSQILRAGLPRGLRHRVAVVSGPNLSWEIELGKPASSVVASQDTAVCGFIQECMTSMRFRIYTSEDVVGVELGGALKNIIALGAGICDGLEYGDNAKAAFMSRGLAEIARLGVAAGADPFTFSGLAGMGDLIATCSSPYSRNRYVGEQLAHGRNVGDILSGMSQVAEGIYSTEAALSLARRFNVEMPITQITFDVLFNGLAVSQAIGILMGRVPRLE